MMAIIYPMIRMAMLIMLISIPLAIIITVTKYLVGMFTALPVLIPLGIFAALIAIVFFIEDGKK